MAVVLLQVLERTELNKLPKGVQNKLEKFITELQNANEALKTQHERFKADSGRCLIANRNVFVFLMIMLTKPSSII